MSTAIRSKLLTELARDEDLDYFTVTQDEWVELKQTARPNELMLLPDGGVLYHGVEVRVAHAS